MPRPPAYHVIDQMLTIMRFINSLAPDDPTIPGESIRVEELAKRVGMSGQRREAQHPPAR